MPIALEDAWPPIRAELRRAVPESSFAMWLEPLEPLELDEDRLVLSGPDHVRRWATDRFARVLDRCAATVLGEGASVEIVAPAERRPGAGPSGGAARQRTRPTPGVGPQDEPNPGAASLPDDAPPNPRLTFDQFIIGDANRLAHAAALAVAESPGQAYNPLFIYGPPGLGKTHLLHSIANYVLAYGGGLSVRLTTVEAFTNEFVAAVSGGGMNAFKSRFRRADVLLVDDVQFLERKVKTEEEFFHTFNALQEMGSQLVVTSDRLPRDLAELEDRLRERFASGLVTDICAPDRATRMTILRKRAAMDRIELADNGALECIADRITDNVRVLEGALIRVVAFASLTGRTVDGALADEVLDGLYRRERPVVRGIDEVQAAASEAFGVSREELVSASRERRLVWPRQVAMYLARELTDQTLPAIGRAFGGRDHTTVMHACRRTAERIAADRVAFEEVRALTERLATRS